MRFRNPCSCSQNSHHQLREYFKRIRDVGCLTKHSVTAPDEQIQIMTQCIEPRFIIVVVVITINLLLVHTVIYVKVFVRAVQDI